jgi:glycosyltransferase involved in cell wall biosynthesis
MHRNKLEPIKVGFVLFDANYVTSTYKIVEFLISALDREKFVPYVFCFLPTARKEWAGVPIFSLNKSSQKAALASAFRLSRLLKEQGIQVTVASNTGPNMATTAATIFYAGLKTIIVEHNTFSKHGGKHPFKRFIAGRLYPRADLIIGVSKGVSQDLEAVFPCVAPKTKTIHNCVLTPPETLEKLAQEKIAHPWFEDKAYPVILNVGELFPRKGQDILLKAFAQVHQTVPARLVIVGTLIERTHQDLLNLASSLGIGDHVAFLGRQENPFQYMLRSDAFVLSSREEGFGLVLVEAMACGCPVVSTDCPYGPNEIIIPEKSGLLVPMDDPQAMSAAIIRVLTTPSLADQLRQGGYARLSKFNRQSFIKNYEAAIEGVMGA